MKITQSLANVSRELSEAKIRNSRDVARQLDTTIVKVLLNSIVAFFYYIYLHILFNP